MLVVGSGVGVFGGVGLFGWFVASVGCGRRWFLGCVCCGGV